MVVVVAWWWGVWRAGRGPWTERAWWRPWTERVWRSVGVGWREEGEGEANDEVSSHDSSEAHTVGEATGDDPARTEPAGIEALYAATAEAE